MIKFNTISRFFISSNLVNLRPSVEGFPEDRNLQMAQEAMAAFLEQHLPPEPAQLAANIEKIEDDTENRVVRAISG